MRKTVLVAAFFCVPAFSQVQGIRTVFDSYYRDYLVFEDSQQVVSSKVNYPGLFTDSLSTIDVGFSANPYYYNFSMDSTYIENNSANLQLSDLNGWGEKKFRFGKIGAWIGNLNFENSEYNNSNRNENRLVRGSSALWFAPYKRSAFKGVSLSFGGEYSKTLNDYLSESSSYTTTSSYRTSNYKDIDVGLNALFQCNKRYHVAVHLINEQSTNISHYRSTNVYTNSYYDYYSNKYDTYNSASINNYGDTLKFQNYGIGLTFIDNKKRQFSVNVNAQTDNSYSSQNYYSNSNRNGYDYGSNNLSFTYDTGNGEISASLAYSDTKVFKYLKHRAYFGINALALFDFPAHSESYLSFKKLIKGVHSNQYSMHYAIYVPVTIDFNLFNTPLYIEIFTLLKKRSHRVLLCRVINLL